jgi:hypothetical protein
MHACDEKKSAKTQHELLQREIDQGSTSVPVPTFVLPCSTHFYERRNQRDTGNSMILARLWI